MLVKVGKRSKRTSNSSQLGTSAGATNEVCALGIESSPDMVTVSPSPWKGMFSMSCALGAGEDGGISIDEALIASLKDKPFHPSFVSLRRARLQWPRSTFSISAHRIQPVDWQPFIPILLL